MRLLQSLQSYLALILCLSVLTSAWPWPRFLPDIDSLIVRRRANGGANSSSQAPATNTGSSSPTQTGSSGSNTITSAPSGSASASSSNGSGNGGGSNQTTPTTTYHTSYDPIDPVGGISMLTPAVTSGEQYYKIGDFVTFGWNYTNVLATPTAIDVLASCSANKQLYTIAVNQTVSNSTQEVVWDTSSYDGSPTIPLLTEIYTLIVYDAASSISAAPQPGYLATFNQFKFGMYQKQPYQGLNEGFVCVTCSSAISIMGRNTLGFMLSMCTITVLSFTWFVGGGLDVVW